MRAMLLLATLAVAAPTAAAAAPALGRCALAVRPGAARPGALADLPTETATGAGLRTRFALLSPAARHAEEVALAAWAPAGQLAVEVDATGMAVRVALRYPARRTPADALRDVLAFVRAHPCLFGVVDPLATTAHLYIDKSVYLDEAPHTIGQLTANFVDDDASGTTTVTLAGHLWPIAGGEVAFEPRHVLARYLGAPIAQDWEDLSTRNGTFGNHRTLRHVTGETDFRYDAGHALICRRDELVVQAVAWIALSGVPDPTAPARATRRLRELPTVVSIDDGEPFGPAWIMPDPTVPPDNSAPDRANPAGLACLLGDGVTLGNRPVSILQ